MNPTRSLFFFTTMWLSNNSSDKIFLNLVVGVSSKQLQCLLLFLFLPCFLVVLGIEQRALHILGRVELPLNYIPILIVA
jgi:hypothetical protein